MQAFFRFFAKLIVTHIFSDVPQLIQHFSDFTSKTLCCLAFITFSLFSFQGTNTLISFETRSQNTIPCVLRSNLNSCLVGPSGLEPPTLRLSVVRSSQLSYGPISRLLRVCTLKIEQCKNGSNCFLRRSDLGNYTELVIL